MAHDPEIDIPPYQPPRSAEAGKPDKQDVDDNGGYDEDLDPQEVDRRYWMSCLEDAERAEKDWRTRGREIVEIYRNETRNTRTGRLSPGAVTFNIFCEYGSDVSGRLSKAADPGGQEPIHPGRGRDRPRRRHRR